jgi:hypothetical protein
MGRPYEWTGISSYPQKMYAVYKGEGPQLNTMDFMQVKELDLEKDYDLVFVTPSTEKEVRRYDFILTNSCMNILLNEKIISLLQELCPEQIQMFDTVIECKDGVITDYKAVNILNEVDVVDLSKSKKSSVSGYLKYCLRADDCMGEIHIGRDKSFKPKIIISSTLKEALEKAKVKGCKYGEGD